MHSRKILFIISILCAAAVSAFAALPQTISYHGYLKNSAGVPVTGPLSVTFSLYSSNPARNNPVWQETQPDVPVSNGIFSVQLGSVTPINAPFDAPYFLGMDVNNSGELPLQPLASTGYAFRATTADNVPASAIAAGTISGQMIASDAITTEKIAAGAVTDTQIGGTIGDAKLSANVALLDSAQTFGAAKTFSTAPSFSAVSGAPFNVTSATQVANLNAEKVGGKTLAEISAMVPADTKPLLTTFSGSGSGTVTSSPAGINCTGTCLDLFGTGTSVTLTAAPAGTSTFAGWSGGVCSGTSTCTVNMDAAKTVNAVFTANNQTLTVSRTGGGTISSSPAGIYCGSNCSASLPSGSSVILTVLPDTGFTFSGWSGACTGTGGCTVTMDAPKSVSARFTAPVTVTKSGSGAGAVTTTPAGISCGPTCSASYDGATTITLTATPDSTSQFSGWSGACSGTGTCTVTIDAAKTASASFTSNTFPMNVTRTGVGDGRVTSSPAGVDCGALCSSPFTTGQVITLTASPDTTSVFSGWSGACTGTGSCNVTMNAAQSVNATFGTKNYSLTATKTGAGTVTSSPGGIYCGLACSAPVLAGTTVILTATPDAGAALGSWTGCDSTNGPTCTTTMNAVKSITASFNPGLSVVKSGTGSGTITSNIGLINCGSTCSATYSTGSSVTLTASPSTNSIFAGWMGACSGTGSCTLTMDAVKSAAALFMLNPQTLVVTVSSGGSVSSSPAGISCQAGTCAASFDLGSTVMLTAAPDGNSLFSGWSGACTGTGSCAVTMNALKSVSAQFTPL